MKEYFYITTTLPYVNALPHIGFALEIVQADALARFKSLTGAEVFFNTGTDEHGQKIAEAAAKEGKEPKDFTDHYAGKFQSLKSLLNLYPDINFIRTTEKRHVDAAQEFWRRCEINGDIYKALYKIKYCIGCELEKTDSELVENKCPLHPNAELETREEENYFFRFSKYEKLLERLYEENPYLVVPDYRFNEMKEFLKRGLKDFSISRPREKLSWGVPVPGDENHVMYVWFDALVNYISTLGWPGDATKFGNFWPGMQIAGKDQIRMQAGMWQAMLLSANLLNTSTIFIHGFINSGGQKMSKSLGNVIDPVVVIEEYGTDALRYFLLREIHPFEDSDFTIEKFRESYNANLANGLGNLVSRVIKMAESYEVSLPNEDDPLADDMLQNLAGQMSVFNFNAAMDVIWQKITLLDKYIQETKPFLTVKNDPEKAKADVLILLKGIKEVAIALEPFMPATSEKIKEALKTNKLETGLFPRKE